MLRGLKIIFLACALAALLSAADVDGIWKAEYTTPDGTQRQSAFHLKASGSRLEGKVVSAMGEAPIQDGTINGEDIAFSVVRNFNGNEMVLKYSGKVANQEIRMTVHVMENSFDIVAKKQ